MSIEVILAMANYCGHCHAFLPIFEKAEKMAKKHEILKDYDVNFEIYDFDSNNEKAKKHEIDFNNEHPEIINNVDGFPTVFVKINGKKGDGNVYATVQHTIDKTGVDDASNDFLDGIANEIKNIDSNGKEKYVNVNTQVGGNNDGFNDYLNYKKKYLTMKKIMENTNFQ